MLIYPGPLVKSKKRKRKMGAPGALLRERGIRLLMEIIH